jgi:tRNA-Thr(GGU) m(6)t(6)A37 methyltransferase TsaA
MTEHGAIVVPPIGRIRSPWPTPAGAPIQPAAARGVAGTLDIDAAYVDGVRDLDGFSHVIVLWHMHLVRGHDLTVVPFLDHVQRGIFATRSPKRPNPIGLSIYRIARIDGGSIAVVDVDAVDGSPILDLKPYVPAFDAPPAERIGWYAGRLDDVATARADDRFA